MGSIGATKPHAVCIPFPAQGHITPMLDLAKLLHQKGFHITFVNTEYNHQRLLKSRGPSALDGLLNFNFRAIPDGLPVTDSDVTQDIPSLCHSTMTTCLPPFRELLKKLNCESSGVPPVTVIVSDGVMSFTLDAAEELGVPGVLFWTTSACGFLAYFHYKDLIERGIIPLKDESYLTNGYLETKVDCIPGMNNIRLRDMPTFIRTTNVDDNMIHFILHETRRVAKASALLFNTFSLLETDVLDAMKSITPPIYTLGPLFLLSRQVPNTPLASLGSNLWKEDETCLNWLDTKPAGSVVYVNFGSITVMSNSQLVEFAWGLCNSNKHFLWIIRPDLVRGDNAVLPKEILEETMDRSMIANWCPQEQVLNHPAVKGFLTHSGWNSTLESISAGVPMLCWPFFAEQQTNCRYSCTDWGIGMEIDNDVNRDEVAALIVELMDGDKGNKMRKRAQEWRNEVIAAAKKDGSSSTQLDTLVSHLLLHGSQVAI